MYRFARFPSFCGAPNVRVCDRVVLEILNGMAERKVGA
jgi:hypothetical protein